MKLKVFTDGACSGNGSTSAKAGWAYAIVDENNICLKKDSGTVLNGTNNIGELMAIIEGIRGAAEFNPDRLVICSDSAYCINGITNWRYNWKKNDWWRDSKKTQELKNRELWITLDHLIDMSYMEFEKVAGHSGVEWNEIVDKLAVARTR